MHPGKKINHVLRYLFLKKLHRVEKYHIKDFDFMVIRTVEISKCLYYGLTSVKHDKIKLVVNSIKNLQNLGLEVNEKKVTHSFLTKTSVNNTEYLFFA